MVPKVKQEESIERRGVDPFVSAVLLFLFISWTHWRRADRSGASSIFFLSFCSAGISTDRAVAQYFFQSVVWPFDRKKISGRKGSERNKR